MADPKHCDQCPLRSSSARVISSRGSEEPAVLLVGEAPGKDELVAGEPFVGPAGEELDSCLREACLEEDQLRWANCVRCMPTGPGGKARAPKPLELASCLPALWAEVERVKPTVIVALGGTAISALLGRKSSVKAARGRVMDLPLPPGQDDASTYRVVGTYHPASVIHSVGRTRPSLVADLRLAGQEAGCLGPGVVTQEAGDYRVVAALEDIHAVVMEATASLQASGRPLSIDVETCGRWFDDDGRILCIGLSWDEGHGVVIPAQHKDSPWRDPGARDQLIDMLRPLLEGPWGATGAYFGYDAHWLSVQWDVHPTLRLDVLDAYRVLNMGRAAKETGLKDLGAELLGVPNWSAAVTQLTGGSMDGAKLEAMVPLETLCHYCAMDTDVALRLEGRLTPLLREAGFDAFYNSFLRGVWALLQEAEEAGAPIDEAVLARLETEYPALIEGAEAACRACPAWGKYERTVLEPAALCALAVRLQKRKRLSPDEQLLLAGVSRLAAAIELDEREQALQRHIAVGAVTPEEAWEEAAQVQASRAQLGAPPTVGEVKVDLANCARQLKLWREASTLSPGSSKQLVLFLFGYLGVPMVEADGSEWFPTPEQIGVAVKDGGPSSDAEHLERAKEWAEEHKPAVAAVIQAILDYRAHTKCYSVFINDFRARYMDSQGRVHPNYHLLGTDTGRLSCSNPGLHQLPQGSPVLEMFCSRWEGGLLLQADLSQLEMRLFAALTGEPGLRAVYARGGDVHVYVASQILGIPEADVDTEGRSLCKSASFAIIYGGGPKAIVRATGCSPDRAKEVLAGFYRTFPAVDDWIQGQRRMVLQYGCVMTPTGRVRWIPEALTSRSRSVLAQAERRAINTPLQGAGSDLTFWGALGVRERYRGRSCQFLYVHDAVYWDVYPGELAALLPVVRWCMVDYPTQLFGSTWLTVPLDVGMKVGPNLLHTVGCDARPEGLALTGDATKVAQTLDVLRQADADIQVLPDPEGGDETVLVTCPRWAQP